MENILEHFEELDTGLQYRVKNWGVSARELATELEEVWKHKLSEEVWAVQNCTANTVVFALEDPNIAACVRPNQTKNIWYNIHTLGRGADHEHIIDHEEGHLLDASVTGNPYSVSGLHDLSDGAKEIFEQKMGVSLDKDRFWVEGFNELRTITRTWLDEDCGYVVSEVPAARKMNSFVQEKSGISPVWCYLRMTPESMNTTLRGAIITTGNVLLMEKIAAEKAGKLWPVQKERILRIAEKTTKKGISLRDESHAWSVITGDDELALAA